MWNVLISFESYTESESKLVIKHLLKCFFSLSRLSLRHKTSLHSNALCTSACVVECPAACVSSAALARRLTGGLKYNQIIILPLKYN